MISTFGSDTFSEVLLIYEPYFYVDYARKMEFVTSIHNIKFQKTEFVVVLGAGLLILY